MVDGDVHPLLGSALRLSQLDARTGFRAPAPHLDGWHLLTEVAGSPMVTACLDELPGTRTGMRNVAAAQLAASLACCLVRPLMAMLHIDHRVPALRPESTHVLQRDGRFHALALDACDIYALPGDPATGHPALHTVTGHDDLDALVARQIHAVLAPVLHTIRAEGRYGLPRLWGAVLDMIGATSLLVARIGGLDQCQVWHRAKHLCALVQELADQPRACHPRPFAVNWSGGEALYTVKGTCCLQYREYGLRAGEGQDGDSYCKTCPFVTEGKRQSQCSNQLEHDMAHAR